MAPVDGAIEPLPTPLNGPGRVGSSRDQRRPRRGFQESLDREERGSAAAETAQPAPSPPRPLQPERPVIRREPGDDTPHVDVIV